LAKRIQKCAAAKKFTPGLPRCIDAGSSFLYPQVPPQRTRQTARRVAGDDSLADRHQLLAAAHCQGKASLHCSISWRAHVSLCSSPLPLPLPLPLGQAKHFARCSSLMGSPASAAATDGPRQAAVCWGAPQHTRRCRILPRAVCVPPVLCHHPSSERSPSPGHSPCSCCDCSWRWCANCREVGRSRCESALQVLGKCFRKNPEHVRQFWHPTDAAVMKRLDDAAAGAMLQQWRFRARIRRVLCGRFARAVA
jgi:hypothetical protein